MFEKDLSESQEAVLGFHFKSQIVQMFFEIHITKCRACLCNTDDREI